MLLTSLSSLNCRIDSLEGRVGILGDGRNVRNRDDRIGREPTDPLVCSIERVVEDGGRSDRIGEGGKGLLG